MREAVKTGGRTLRFDRRTLEDFAASLDLSPHSIASYKKCLAYFFKYLSSKGIDKPEERHIAAYREELMASGRKANTVYGYLAAVRAFFRWAWGEGLYRDISAKVSVPRAEQSPNRKTLTALQLKKLMSSIDRESLQGMRDYAILALMLTTGLSALEISRINAGDIGRSGEGGVLHVRGNDGQKHETVGVPAYVMEVISKYLSARGEGGLEAPLFVSVSNRNGDKNEHMSAGSIGRVAKNALRGAGYDEERLSAQSLKVSAMKLALQGGERLEDVQKFARHRTIRTTFLYDQNSSPREMLRE